MSCKCWLHFVDKTKETQDECTHVALFGCICFYNQRIKTINPQYYYFFILVVVVVFLLDHFLSHNGTKCRSMCFVSIMAAHFITSTSFIFFLYLLSLSNERKEEERKMQFNFRFFPSLRS